MVGEKEREVEGLNREVEGLNKELEGVNGENSMLRSEL